MESFQLSALEEMLEKFLDAAARGDLAQVTSLLSHSPLLLNQKGQNGWTALMLAARNGHCGVAEALLAQGCDKFSVNSSSQTAYDISKFWGHRNISNLLGRSDEGCERVLPGSDPHQHENYFSREMLDRLSAKRADKVWLETKQGHPETVYLIFSNLSPMVTSAKSEDGGEQGQSRLCRLRYEAVKDLLLKPETSVIFLGVEKSKKPSSSSSSSSSSSQTEEVPWEPPAWFAVESNEDAADLLKRCREKSSSFTKMPFRDLLKLNEEEAGVVAQARAVLAWHSRYSFCPTCGSSTAMEDGGYKRRCLNTDCRSLRGVHNTCYPRVDPVVIMLVIHPDGNHCLLGRKKTFPSGFFSCLAGFVEPGESVEEAVRREAEEESGVKVGPVSYVSCQPWPMPSTLMIGCHAVAISTEIKVDEDEIDEAKWFTRQQVVEALLRSSGAALVLPPRQTIAHQLVKHWIGMSANL